MGETRYQGVRDRPLNLIPSLPGCAQRHLNTSDAMKYDVSQTLHAISHVVDFQWCTQLVECLNNKLRDVDIIIHWSIDVYWFEAPSLIYSKAFYRPNVCLKTNLTEAKYSPIPIPSYTPVVSSCRSHCFFLAMPQIERFPQPDKSRLD